MMHLRKQSGSYPIACFALIWTVLLSSLFIVSCGPKFQLTPLTPADPPVVGENGMVVAAHPLAAETGVRILQEGGNAADAALAVLFMLNVVEPHASGIGGGGFALVKMAVCDSKVSNYREKAAKNLDLDFYYDPADSNRVRMKHGGSAVCVPGAAAGWAELYDNWATMPLERLAQDAINTAETGFSIGPTLSDQIKGHYEMIFNDSLMSDLFLNDGLPYEVGDTLRQPMLADLFRQLVDKGLRTFYRGPIAEAVVEAAQAADGFIELSDLEFFRPIVMDPLICELNGRLGEYTALTIPPPSRGGAAMVEALNLFSIAGVYEQPAHSAESIHLMSQCLQQAYADARARIGDPQFVKLDWREMTTMEFAGKASDGISLDAKAGPREACDPPDINEPGNTTHLVVVDKWGNAVSLTQTINHFFGAGVIVPRYGFLLNNQMDDFSMPSNDSLNQIPEPNLMEGGKRPRSNMAPLILLKNKEPFLVVGTPGGTRIIAAMAELVANTTVYGKNISEGIDYPRFFPVAEHIVLENRYNEGTLKRLKKYDYVLHLSGPYHVYFGGAHGIIVDPESKLIYGAADKRRGGAARGY